MTTRQRLHRAGRLRWPASAPSALAWIVAQPRRLRPGRWSDRRRAELEADWWIVGGEVRSDRLWPLLRLVGEAWREAEDVIPYTDEPAPDDGPGDTVTIPPRTNGRPAPEADAAVRAAQATVPLLPDDGKPTDELEREELRAMLDGLTIEDLPDSGPRPALVGPGLVAADGQTILYGAGGIGKGVVACSVACELVAIGYRVLILDYEGHPEEFGPRIRSLAAQAGLDVSGGRIGYLNPLSPRWQPAERSIFAAADWIRRYADAFAYTFVIVDSIVPACFGKEPKDATTAADYAAAMVRIGRPSLSLAHVTKSDATARYPFGSVMFHNLARLTWAAQPDSGGGHGIILRPRKANASALAEPVRAAVTWGSDGRPEQITYGPFHVSMADRLADALADLGTATVDDLDDYLNGEDERTDDAAKADRETIARTLRRFVAGNRTGQAERFVRSGRGKATTWRAAE